MIVLVLRGGLGNQMYEYATAIAMAEHCHTSVVLNTKLGFITDKEFKRKYCLDCFGINYVHNRLLCFDFIGGSIVEKISSKLGRHILVPWYKVVSDKKIDINDLIAHPELYSNVILEGTWNHMEKFCCLYDVVISNAFQLKWEKPAKVQHYHDKIIFCNKPVVAVGVRLFQEIKNRVHTPERQNALSASYYMKAMNWFLDKYGDVKFMVFTQVPQWFRDNISSSEYDYEIVDTGSQDLTAVFDMFLFASCNHYILSNSTFYAWGEKLNHSESKDVVVPKSWSMESKKNWIRIESEYEYDTKD